MTQAEHVLTQAERARRLLLGFIMPGDTIYTIDRTVPFNATGKRQVSVLVINNDRIDDCTEAVALALSEELTTKNFRRPVIDMTYVGADVGAQIVERLGKVLFGLGRGADPYVLNHQWL